MMVVVLLAGCATPTSGVVPRGDGLYTITRQGEGFWVTTDTLKTQALKDAAEHCAQSKQALKLIHSKEIPAGAFGRWPEAEVLFKCQ